MEFKKKTLETQIIEIFQKISPAITRLIQSETDNANIVINLGKTKSKNKNEININPSILVNAVSDSELEFKEFYKQNKTLLYTQPKKTKN